MRKEKSWTRYEYMRCYKLLRRGMSFDEIWFQTLTDREALKAADYSYQAKDHNLHGWSSNIRHSRFLQIKWRVYTRRGEIPY